MKTIIALFGKEKSGKTEVARILSKMSFHHIDMNQKIKEYAEKLMVRIPDYNTFDSKYIDEVREMGYSKSNKLWINLILFHTDKKYERIVVDNMAVNDLDEDLMKSYYVSRESHCEIPENMHVIYNVGTLEDLESKCFKIFKKYI